MLSIVSQSKEIGKSSGRVRRGKAIHCILSNTVAHLRSCPPKTPKQKNKLKLRSRFSRILVQNNFKDSKSWKDDDLHYVLCKIFVPRKSSLVSISKLRDRTMSFATARTNFGSVWNASSVLYGATLGRSYLVSPQWISCWNFAWLAMASWRVWIYQLSKIYHSIL